MFSRSKMWLAACGPVLLAFLTACARDETRPEITDIRLTLLATPSVADAAHPVTVSVRVANAGSTRMWHCQGCGCGNGISIVLLGPDGATVLLEDPRRGLPMCADGPSALDPGGVLSGGAVFTGKLFTRDSPTFPSPTYAAPPGRYTVIAGFSYEREWLSGSSMSREERTTFTWRP